MTSEFKLGHVYYAAPAMTGLRREIVVPIGRSEGDVQLALINGISNGRIVRMEGREFVQFTTMTGVYSASSAAEANANETAIVNDILKGRGDHVFG